ncbi:MAG: class I SAM-dependent methyltransferase family protein, partial [Phycisphaerae bacterium]|nr:class I SAM-dependent methyltransferase family protein [Phycisphaerae bacterium]
NPPLHTMGRCMDCLATEMNEIAFERHGLVQRLLKASVVNPLANYLPPALFRALLRFGKSELAASNWADPGGWRSMVISYDGKPRQIADKILVGAGTIPMALRNRRKLAAKTLAILIDESPSDPVHALCVGAGPGRIIMDAMLQAKREAYATLVDVNTDPFEHGRLQARQEGLDGKVRFIQCDVRDGVGAILDHQPDIVKMVGICEYLLDPEIVEIARAVAAVMPAAAPIVFNSLSDAHGTDRFFRRVFGLHMNHRTPAQLQELMQQAGFDNFDAHPEPLGVYHVIVGRRAAEPTPDPAKGNT